MRYRRLFARGISITELPFTVLDKSPTTCYNALMTTSYVVDDDTDRSNDDVLMLSFFDKMIHAGAQYVVRSDWGPQYFIDTWFDITEEEAVSIERYFEKDATL